MAARDVCEREPHTTQATEDEGCDTYGYDDARAFAPPPAVPAPRSGPPRRTTFRRWKWEAASLAPSAIVPQLSRRAGAAGSTAFGDAHMDDEVELRALLTARPAARPAACAAAAALRALAPYMSPEERGAMRARFAALPPLDALDAVFDVARQLCARREPASVWGTNANGAPGPLAPVSGSAWSEQHAHTHVPRVPGALAAVWQRPEQGQGQGSVQNSWDSWVGSSHQHQHQRSSPPATPPTRNGAVSQALNQPQLPPLRRMQTPQRPMPHILPPPPNGVGVLDPSAAPFEMTERQF